jgi:hypothetical protein
MRFLPEGSLPIGAGAPSIIVLQAATPCFWERCGRRAQDHLTEETKARRTALLRGISSAVKLQKNKVILSILYVCLFAPIGVMSARASTAGNVGSNTSSKVTGTADKASESTCATTGQRVITITCAYPSGPGSAAQNNGLPIAIKNFMVSFNPKEEGPITIELTFANVGNEAVQHARPVYLAVDDEEGKNYFRRELKEVDLANIASGQTMTFREEQLIAAFPQGHYFFHLWMPSNELAQTFDFRYNALLANEGLAETGSGLDRLADFTVVRGASAR